LEVWLLFWWRNITFWQSQWLNSDETVMRQWCNSDWTVMPSIWAFYYYFWYVIDHVLSFYFQAFEMSLIMLYPFAIEDHLKKQWWESDLTVIRQWCNSDQTVIPLIWALLCHFQAFEMLLIIIYLLTMHLKCD
jgi:hypothetical protein